MVKKATNIQLKRGLWVMGVALLVVLWGSLTNWKFIPGAATPDDGTTPPTTPTAYAMSPTDYVSSSALGSTFDPTCAWYKADTTGLDPADIQDLEFSDFTLDDADSDLFTPSADEVYVVKVTATGYQTRWCTTNPLIADGKLLLLELGTNTIPLMNQTTDVGMLAYEKDTLDSTVTLTAQRDWVIMTQTIGYDNEPCNDQGNYPIYDFENAVYNWTLIRVTFNDTATADLCRLTSGYDSNEIVSTVYIYYEVNAVLLDDDIFEIKFSSDAVDPLVTGPQPVEIAIGVGCATSNIIFDTQA